MTLVRHLLAADLRRFRSPLTAWVALVAIMGAIEAARPRIAGNAPLLEWSSVAASLLTVVSALFFATMVAAVVQTHNLVGTTAFWLARPIPARSLLMSKVLLLFGALVAVPIAVDLLVMLPYRVPGLRVLQTVLQGVLLRAATVAVLMCAAAITKNLTRFAVLCISVVAGVALLGALGISAMLTAPDIVDRFVGLQGGGLIQVGRREVDWTPEVIAVILAISAAAALLITQYATRSIRKSLQIGAVGAFIAVSVPLVWPWRILVPRQSPPGWAATPPVVWLDPGSVKFDVIRAGAATDPWRVARARAAVSGVPSPWIATMSLAGATLQVPGTTPLSSPAHGWSEMVTDEESAKPVHRIMQDALGVTHIDDLRFGVASGHTAVVFLGRQSDVQQLAGKPATYSGDFRIDLTEIHRVATLPLERNVVFQDGDYRFQIDEVRGTATDDGLYMRARISESRSVFDRRPPSEYIYFLRNAGADRAIAGYAQSIRNYNTLTLLPQLGFQLSGFSVHSSLMRFNVPDIRQDIARGAAPEWLRGAELVILKATGEAWVKRHVDLSAVPLVFPAPLVRAQ